MDTTLVERGRRHSRPLRCGSVLVGVWCALLVLVDWPPVTHQRWNIVIAWPVMPAVVRVYRHTTCLWAGCVTLSTAPLFPHVATRAALCP